MVARDNLVQTVTFGVLLESDEVLEQVEKTPILENSAHQHLKLQRGCLGTRIPPPPRARL